MKYHQSLTVSYKSAVMSSPARLLAEDACLPAAVIRKNALVNNISWMQRYAEQRGVSLAPHGKTTMTPWIFHQQQQAGAWAIGVGSAWQASVAFGSGIERVLMVNQLVGKANMQLIARLKAESPATDFICLVDDAANAQALANFFHAEGQTLDVLVELGVAGGRCGCRTESQALELARYIASLPGLHLRGLELYEGVLHGDDPQPAVEDLLRRAAQLACQMADYVEGEFILTGAGSVWYDVVCNIWLQEPRPANCRIVIRPGCYITHDIGIYQQAQEQLLARDPTARELEGGLNPALELIAMVQSVPEPGRAVVNIGKRDSAFDAGLPQPIAHYRAGERRELPPRAMSSQAIMDQHCMLEVAPDHDLRVGDIIIFGTSHPCLTFDKWRVLLLVDDDYRVLDELETCF